MPSPESFGPEFKAVGGAKELSKAQAVKVYEDRFSDQDAYINSSESAKEIFKHELPKTQEEIQIIAAADNLVSKVMDDVDCHSYSIPLQNFHVLPQESFNKLVEGQKLAAAASPSKQLIAYPEKTNTRRYLLARSLIHEIVHIKGKHVLEVEDIPKEDGTSIWKSDMYRTGLHMYSSQKKDREGNPHEHFMGLNEAFVAMLEEQLAQHVLDFPGMEQEKEYMQSDEYKELLKDAISKGYGSEKDITYVYKDEHGLVAITKGYKKQWEVLTYVIEQICDELPDSFVTSQDVFKILIRGHFGGELLEFARSVEETFGKGSFRDIGDMDITSNSATLVLEKLKKNRAFVLKAQNGRKTTDPSTEMHSEFPKA